VTAARPQEQEQPLPGGEARSAGDERAAAGESPWPQQVLLHERSGALALRWGAEAPALLAGHRLRAACRCAGCEHARRGGDATAVDSAVRLQRVSPIGEFGLQLHFSDGHERGIYPWPYLRELALEIAP
jgi:DUF971 family protein